MTNTNPCRKGHPWNRYPTGHCKDCMAEWRLANSEKVNKIFAEYRERNRSKVLLRTKNWQTRNKEHLIAYRKINKAKILAKANMYYATKLNATPRWADKDLIKDIYMEAQYHQMHVDHIIPLNSKVVCGLHWEGNLQLLSPQENTRKSNRITAPPD